MIGLGKPNSAEHARSRLAEHVEGMWDRVDASTSTRLLSLTRQLLETLNDGKNFPHLQLFCDWFLHPQIDRSSELILSKVDMLLNEMMQVSRGYREEQNALLEITSVRKMVRELGLLLQREGISSRFLSDRNTSFLFCGCVLDEIQQKPIARKENRFDKAVQSALDAGHFLVCEEICLHRRDAFRVTGPSYTLKFLLRKAASLSEGPIILENPFDLVPS